MDIIQRLMESLGVNEDQAKGGAGLIFKVIREKLGDANFSKIAESVPGVEKLIGDAPKAKGGLSGAIKGIASALGGKAETASDAAGLVSGFSKLGLGSGMIAQFASAIVSFVQEKGGDELKGLVEKVMPG
jgi:hypothetical protein